MLRWTVKLGRRWGALPAGLLVAACAGGFSPDRSVTQITTDPPAARCTLQGAGFNQIIQTPVHVVLPKEAAPVTMSCAGAGYRTFVTTLKPVFNGQVFGNLLTGSVLGVVIDFANGHDLKYPRQVHVNMEPTVFPTAEARDRWFERFRTHLIEKWSDVAVDIRNNCSGADAESTHCRAKTRAAEADRARELALLEQRRRQARVGHIDTAEDTGASLE
jgi:hypothetical protein